MITLHFKTQHADIKEGVILHLKVVSIAMKSPGRWHLVVDDVTPLPGAEAGYICGICGITEPPGPDGLLPAGWIEKQYEQGSKFLCPECVDSQICRVCGCSQYEPCETESGPCHWVEEDLCSACANADRLS